ncbi:polyketide synthase dehydratase domain-containing protein [Archangium gephyra]|uniref:type I polyketide synthase n=1 Tax=Archangium gephyra TaxID=48 RepID=UPI0035D48E11
MSSELSRLVASLPEEKRRALAKLLHPANEAIAIVGLGCRFPGNVTDSESYLKLLMEGQHAVQEIPEDRRAMERFFDPNPGTPGRFYTRHGGFIEGVDLFDADFFGITPREAEAMDPQQRLLLEVGWEALEHAGLVPETVGANTGVFVGICSDDYITHQIRSGDPKRIDVYSLPGNIPSIASGRVSYALNLRGPNSSVDTACSSSLVAIHQGVSALRLRECDVALAGGVNLVLSHENTIYFSTARLLSPEGKCKAFDSNADGFVRAEGCGMVVLKRLSDAINDGDSIIAVVRGSAVNHNGFGNGLTAPNVLGQRELLRKALADGGVKAEEVGFVEAHGTGTSMGDAIEVDALKEVFGTQRADGSKCFVGSVKTNIGHMEGAAGVGGFIKAALMLEREFVAPNINFTTLNPKISLEGTPLAFPTETRSWKRGTARRFAAVSSFGFGGTNANVVLEEAPVAKLAPVADGQNAYVLPLSAKSDEALRALATRYVEWLGGYGQGVHDLCFTASVRRSHHGLRLAATGRTPGELRKALSAWLAGDASAVELGQRRERRAKTVLVLDANAACAPELREALNRFPAARTEWEASQRVLAGTQLEQGRRDGLTAQLALAALVRAAGLRPDSVVIRGDVGVLGAYLLGALKLEDAVAKLARGEHEANNPAVTRDATGGADASAIRFDLGALVAGTEPLAGAWARAYVRGAAFNFRVLFPEGGRCLRVPTYPFQRRRFWIADSFPAEKALPVIQEAASHPLIGTARAVESGMQWESTLSVAKAPYMVDHQVQGMVVVPGTAYLEMAMAAAHEVFGPEHRPVDAVAIKQAMVLADKAERTVRVQVERRGQGGVVRIRSAPKGTTSDAAFVEHLAATIAGSADAGRPELTLELQQLRERCRQPVTDHYETLAAQSVVYGPTFQGVESMWLGRGEAVAKLRLPEGVATEGYLVHPAFLDACLQVFAATLIANDPDRQPGAAYVPVAARTLQLHRVSASREAWGYAVMRAEAGSLAADVLLLDEQGRVLVEIRGLVARRVEGEGARKAAAPAASATERLVEYLQQNVARSLRVDTARIDVRRPLSSLGLDSLMAVELKNRVESELGVVVPAVEFLKASCLADVATEIERRRAAPRAEERKPDNDPSALLNRLGDLSDTEVRALLTRLLPTQPERGSRE